MNANLKGIGKFSLLILASSFLAYAPPVDAGWVDNLKKKANTLMVAGLWEKIDPTLRSCMVGKLETPIKKLKEKGESPYDSKFNNVVADCYGQAGAPVLGVVLAKVPAKIANRIDAIQKNDENDSNIESVKGALLLVTQVKQGSVAEKAGLQDGDIIYSFLGRIFYKNKLTDFVRLAATNIPQVIRVWRDKKFIDISLNFPSQGERLALSEEYKKEKEVKRQAKLAEKEKLAEEAVERAKQNTIVNKKMMKNPEFETAVVELFSGHKKDLIYLLNKKAAGLTRGLSGNIVFSTDKPSSCYIAPAKYNPKSNKFHKREHHTTIKKLQLDSLSFRKCKHLLKEESQVLVLTNDLQNLMTTDRLRWLLEHYRDGKFQLVHISDYATIEAEEIAAKRAEQKRKLAKSQAEERSKQEIAEKKRKIEEGVLAGKIKGYGLFTLANKSKPICIEETNSGLLKEILSENGISDVRVNNLEKTFITIKTNKCKAFFGSSESLKILAEALQRDKVKFAFSNFWLTTEELVEKRKQIAKKKGEAKEKAARERAARDKAEVKAKKEQAAREKAYREKASREQAAREKIRKERAKRLNKLNNLEKFVLTGDRKYYLEIIDSGGLKLFDPDSKFFGLAIHSFVREGKTIIIDTLNNPKEIRTKVGEACGIKYSTWKVKTTVNMQTGKGRGVFCDADYQPIDNNNYSIAIKHR